MLPILPLNTTLDVAFSASNIATCCLSNVPGPQQLIHLAGAAVENVEFYLFGPIGVYIGVFSYNGAVSITVNADTKVGADPSHLCRLFVQAFEEIYKDVCGESKPQAE